MMKNLRSACLLFFVFLFLISIFAGIGSAEDAYNYSFNKNNYTGRWENLSSPTSVYKIWGYPGKEYSFTTEYNCFLFSNDTTMVFYWDCQGNKSHYTSVQMKDGIYHYRKNDTVNCSHYTHSWDRPGTYYVSVGVFQDGKPVNVSYWVPVKIENNTTIKVQDFSMLDEEKGFEGNDSTHVYRNNSTYCGYEDNEYSFSVKLNGTSLREKNTGIPPEANQRLLKTDIENLSEIDTRNIMETTTIVRWDDSSSDNSIFGNITNDTVISDNNASIKFENSTTAYVEWNKNFTHEWNNTGEKNIRARFFHWDPLDGQEMYSKPNEEINKSILIIRDPKNFVSASKDGSPIGSFLDLTGFSLNLQSLGIFFSIIGLTIFYFTYTRNNVPIKISIFGMKPFYLKSVNSLTGTLIFVAGIYLHFVFGRCPWDIPIVSNIDWLSKLYFGVLYYEYVPKPFSIPYMSILIGLLDVIILSLIIHLVAIPFYKGEFKIGEFLRKLKPGDFFGKKRFSTSVQPEQVPLTLNRK